MTQKFCTVTSKIAYKNAGEANREMAKVREKFGATDVNAAPQSIYRCPYCKKWHHTSLSREQGRLLEARRRLGVVCPTYTGEIE